jgi:hypothetical protein
MGRKLLKTAMALAAVLVLGACSEAPKPAETKSGAEAKQEPPKPTGPVGALTAFYEMYKPARTWAADLLPLSLTGKDVPSMKSEAGKSPVWTAVFVSPGRHEARTFTYSVVEDGANLHKGVAAGAAEPWTGATAGSMPFQTTEFVTDSDVAYKAALVKAAVWVKKHPDKKATLLLSRASRFPAPAWLVIWGTPKLGYAAYVNATTGMVLK